jgi:hypothetical protein
MPPPSIGPDEDLGQLLAHADDQPADDGAGHRGEAAQDHHRQRLQRHQRQRELHAQLAAPDDAGHQRHEAGHAPDDDPDAVERDADRLRRLVVVGHRAQRAAGGGVLEEQRQRDHQRRGDAGGIQVFLVDQHAALEHVLQQEHRVLGQADVDLVDVAAEQRLAEAVEEVGDAQRGHQQRDALLVDQLAQHQALDQPGHHDHHRHRGDEGQQVGQQLAVGAQQRRDPLGKRAIASAANSTIAPCAKLKTPLALKMSTKPSATSEYSMPDIRPPIRVSRKKVPCLVSQWLVPR